MLRQTALFLIAAALVGHATVDANIAFTAPNGAEWKAGSKHYITWMDGDGQGMPETTDFYLVTGDPTALQLAANVASGVSTAPGTYEWTIPSDIKPGKYALRAGNNDAYSPFFTILEADSETTPVESSAASSATIATTPSSSKSYAATVTVTITADESGAIITPTPTSNSSASSASLSSASSVASESSASLSSASASSASSKSSVISSATSVLSSVASSVSSVLSSATETASETTVLSESTTEATSASETSSETPTPTDDAAAANGVGQISPSILVASAVMILGYISNLA